VDRHRRAVQEGRAHRGGEGDEGLLLAFLLDLHDARGRDLRLLRAHDVELEKPGFLPGPEVDHLRALDEAPRLEVEPLAAVLERQLDPVADQRLAGQKLRSQGAAWAVRRRG
jgi:hypothetical protein